jgi:integrase
MADRERVGQKIINELRARLAPVVEDPGRTLFLSALEMAVELKRSSKESTNKAFRENARWLSEFFQERGWQSLRCFSVTQEHIQAYFDDMIVRKKVRNSTHNTRKNHLRSLLGELVRRDYFNANFAAAIKDRPKSDPIRRPLTEVEKAVLFRHAFQNDRALALAMTLLGFLAIRPGELRDLKVGAIDLKRGLVSFPAAFSKNNRASVVTIPEEIVPVLESFGLEKWPPTYYLFGRAKGKHNSNLLPMPDRIGKNTLSYRFRQAVRQLHRAGALPDIRGVEFYSLKDSLAIYLLDNGVDVESAMRHFRHHDLAIFQRYVKRLGVVNEKIKSLPASVPGFQPK